MPAKPTKKHTDVLLLPKPTGAGKQKSRPQRRRGAGPRRKRTEKRKRKRDDGAPRRRLASDPSKRPSDAKTKNRGVKLPNGPGRRPRQKSPGWRPQARSAFLLKKRRRGRRRRRDGGLGRRPKNRWCPRVAKRRVAAPERS